MIPGQISRRIVLDRLNLIKQMVSKIQALPVESCLRRALEALFDSGRHILARGFAIGIAEYKQIGPELQRQGILNPEEGAILRMLAGYRNRMVHFYHEISPEELYQIARTRLGDVQRIAGAIARWLEAHPDQVQDDW